MLLNAKRLAEATGRIVEIAKACAAANNNNTNSYSNQQHAFNLRQAADELNNALTCICQTTTTRTTTSTTSSHETTNNNKSDETANSMARLTRRLELCAKQAASSATQCIAAIQVCTAPDETNNNVGGLTVASNRLAAANQAAMRARLVQQCKQVADLVPRIVLSIRAHRTSRLSAAGAAAARNKRRQLVTPACTQLMNACGEFVAPVHAMIQMCKTSAALAVGGGHATTHEIRAIQMRTSLGQLVAAIDDLKLCLATISEAIAAAAAAAAAGDVSITSEWTAAPVTDAVVRGRETNNGNGASSSSSSSLSLFAAEQMMRAIGGLDRELAETRHAATIYGALKPLPGETVQLAILIQIDRFFLSYKSNERFSVWHSKAGGL